MRVFKFGGASVKDAAGIKNLKSIVEKEEGELVIVVSAFGKTTNALEQLLKYRLAGNEMYSGLLEEICNYHKQVAFQLAGEEKSPGKLDNLMALLQEYIGLNPEGSYDFKYDQVVSNGELWSTVIVAEYLSRQLGNVEWVDIRESLATDDRYRDANILWTESLHRVRRTFDFSRRRIYVTQGFIGGTVSGYTTTLGREGSDYTAAILANMLDAEKVVVWKDVPGILNADPKWIHNAVKLDEITYAEAVEMTFSGAKVIHPKTIKPLHNKSIPLHVKSFIEPEGPGTVIKGETAVRTSVPVFIRKEEQMLISISPRDFSFAMGDNLNRLFHLFKIHGIRANLVEASAIKIDVCVDDERPRVETLMADLKNEYSFVFNEMTEILSIRYYNADAVSKITEGREILLEQRTRNSVRFVVRKK